MKVLLLYAHPVETSFGAALHRLIVERLVAGGHEVDDCDLYAEEFDPRLSRAERLAYNEDRSAAETMAPYVRRLQAADALVLCFPVWNYGYPAILKGFFDRVFLPGFAFRYRGQSQAWDKLLSGRTADLLVTLDTPPWYFRWIYGAPAHRQMVRTILGFCGIKTRRLTEFSPVRPSSEEQRQSWLRKAEILGSRC